MPEILYEEINELALEKIGDNIIGTENGTPYIYEEYIETIRNILESMR